MAQKHKGFHMEGKTQEKTRTWSKLVLKAKQIKIKKVLDAFIVDFEHEYVS